MFPIPTFPEDNIDNLVNVSYQGGVEEKKRYDKQLKENKDIVDQIIEEINPETIEVFS